MHTVYKYKSILRYSLGWFYKERKGKGGKKERGKEGRKEEKKERGREGKRKEGRDRGKERFKYNATK